MAVKTKIILLASTIILTLLSLGVTLAVIVSEQFDQKTVTFIEMGFILSMTCAASLLVGSIAADKKRNNEKK